MTLPLRYLLKLSSRLGAYRHLKICSVLFRLNWAGIDDEIHRQVNKVYLDETGLMSAGTLKELLSAYARDGGVHRPIDSPAGLLDGMVTVISPRTESCKGVIVIAYSVYFLYFLRCFDIALVSKNYHIVLEPSWNGLCEPAILAFASLQVPVFVMAYEDRDYDFLDSLSSNLVPLRLSANWWLDPSEFAELELRGPRDLDIVMVASWALFKRHWQFLKDIKKLAARRPNLKIALIGYPVDLTIDEVRDITKMHGLESIVEIHEWLPMKDVWRTLARAKVSLVWSRFEGVNRAIIESMYCDTPCIIREGFNFGMKYPYINQFTGKFVAERRLLDGIERVLDGHETYQPHEWISENHNCHVAVTRLGEEIQAHDPGFDPQYIVPKKSGLNGMEYLSRSDQSKFAKDYEFLTSTIVA